MSYTEACRLWVCTDHDGHYVGGASVVWAPSEDEARTLLMKELPKAGLRPERPFTLKEVDLSEPFALILRDGDY
jgi:hypothetical protein